MTTEEQTNNTVSQERGHTEQLGEILLPLNMDVMRVTITTFQAPQILVAGLDMIAGFMGCNLSILYRAGIALLLRELHFSEQHGIVTTKEVRDILVAARSSAGFIPAGFDDLLIAVDASIHNKNKGDVDNV